MRKEMKKYIKTIVAVILLTNTAVTTNAQSFKNKQLNSTDIIHAINKLNKTVSVLYVAAHPDDENTRLIAYLANHMHVRTGYLSMTRGDGGQNLIGAERGAMLGILRTQELLEARRIDGGEQFFTRANDFGYSKTPEETFEIWGKDSILADVVLTIRRFKPDVMITRFPADGRGGHGHHTASAILAEEAFDLAADPSYNPWSIKVPVHQTKRLMLNKSSWWDPDIAENAKKDDNYIILDVGEYNPLLAKSYMEIASESRSMHKSQGFGSGKTRGSHYEYLYYIKGEKHTEDFLFSGINSTWTRVKNGSAITDRIERALKAYKPENPRLIIPILMQVHYLLKELEPTEHWARVKLQELEPLIFACAGVWTEATAEDYVYSYGDEIKINAQAIQRTHYPIKLEKVVVGGSDTVVNDTFNYNSMFSYSATVKAPNKTTNPYWLNNENYFGRYHVANINDLGNPENKVPLNVEFHFDVLGVKIIVTEPVVHKSVDRVDGELYRPLVIAPAITANIQSDVYLSKNGQEKEVKIKLKAHKKGAVGSLFFDVPKGWTYTADELKNTATPFMPVVLFNKGDEKDIVVKLTPGKDAEDGELKLKFRMQDDSDIGYALSMHQIEYPHIHTQVMYTQAKAKLINLSLTTTQKRIGYIKGAGDNVAESLREIGYEVMFIDPEELSAYELQAFDVIIGGIRAYNTRDNLIANNDKLMEFVKQGGIYIVQYNTSGRWSQLQNIGPYPFKISRDRVTKEDAPATMLKNNVLKKPNKIEESDFNGWVQERGLYFANEWDSKYQTAISWNDPGEEAKEGALLIGEYGNGAFMYTGISFFRQLPAGVPGAYKLLVNMIEYGK